MDFLTNSIFSEENRTLLGVTLTHFDPTEYTGRAQSKMYSLEDLIKVYPSLQPRGFRVTESGELRSDTNARTLLSNDIVAFIEAEYARIKPKRKDITDLVLFGVENGGATCLNSETDLKAGSLSEPPILVPFQNYKVSSSSMNIYAPFKAPDGRFRTHSLLEMEDGGSKHFFAMFPAGTDLRPFYEMVGLIGTMEVDGTEMDVYDVQSFLEPSPVRVGEAFLNYLAYNVAYYDIGKKVMKDLVPSTFDDRSSEVSPMMLERRKPSRNCSIIHNFKKAYTEDILRIASDASRLNAYMEAGPESIPTFLWLQEFMTSPWYTDKNYNDGNMSEDEEEMVRRKTTAMNLMIAIRRDGLKFGLELLTHRAYQCTLFPPGSELPWILKGGEVYGQSAKKVTF